MQKVILLFNTIKFLKPIQVYYRLYYFARRRIRNIFGFKYPLALSSNSVSLNLQSSIASYTSVNNKTFNFLNLSHTFENGINWNFSEYGKLWTYNLTYFEFLQQEDMSKERGLELIYNFIEQSSTLKDGLEPFPISLRGINWVKFLSAHAIKDQKIDESLYAQYTVLMDNLEYHLLGNHLLENGFSLLLGSYYFQDELLYGKAKQILKRELREEILDDGGHFELSPMYHQLMLFRLLECINLVQNNNYKNQELLLLLEEKAESMLGWLNAMTFKNGAIPLFNDSANGIAPTTAQIDHYAEQLGFLIPSVMSELGKSGYRKFVKQNYELVVDVGNIGPDYIPGHAHSDIFNFELHIDKEPFIVDTGLSTYEINVRRQLERSTQSHNTVVVDNLDQSEIWGGFRVANRATIIMINENTDEVEALHDGYKKIGILHTRKFEANDESIKIVDSIDSNNKHQCLAYLHFYPGITVKKSDSSLVTEQATVFFEGHTDIEICEYSYAPEFNKMCTAQYAIIGFEKKLSTKIIITNEKGRSYEDN